MAPASFAVHLEDGDIYSVEETQAWQGPGRPTPLRTASRWARERGPYMRRWPNCVEAGTDLGV
jgi:hypothetical protein